MIKKYLQNIFKNITYGIFKLLYGSINSSIKPFDDKRILLEKTLISENLSYKIFSALDSRLYTDRIHDTAIIIDNKIVEGPSFQLRKNHANSKISDNIVFKKGTPRFLRKLNGSVLSLLTGGGGNSTYWHWIFDVLPRLKICENVKDINSINYFLFPDLKKNFQRETLKILGFSDTKILSSVNYRHIKANEIIATDHPYVFSDDVHGDAQKIPLWIIKWLREKFLNKVKNQKNFPKKIYIDRSDSKSNISHLRSIENETEVREYLKKQGFEPVRLSDLSFTDQVNLFNKVEVVTGLHGSGFANIIFCKSGTRVIEFRNSSSGPIIGNIAEKNSLNYSPIIVQTKNIDFGLQQGHINISIQELSKLLKD